MKFPNNTRHGKVMVQVNNLFIKESIKSFPINPFYIINNNKWGLVTYSELAREQGVTVKDIVTAFQSEDGYTIYDGNNYTIAYNDTIPVVGRIRFTLMHEIGHIYLNHLIDFDETVLLRSTLTEAKYKVLENEANAFARNVMAPVMVVKGLNIKYLKEVMKYFEISKAAAKVRLEALKQDYIRLSGQFIRFQREHFHPFVHSALHSKTCLECNFSFTNEKSNFCPNCGSSNLTKQKRGDDFMVKYAGIAVDSNGKALICPRCQNEELNYQGEFCKVCGTNIVNRCESIYNNRGYLEVEGCNSILDGNSRYCIHCGNPSSFLENGHLKAWNYVPNKVLELPF